VATEKEICMPKGNSLNSDIYGSDDMGAADAIETNLDADSPTLDVHGAKDSRAVSEGNHGKD
jgi:hypothetical protein